MNTDSLREALNNAHGVPTRSSYKHYPQGPGAPNRKFYYTFTIGENTVKGFHQLLDIAEEHGLMAPNPDDLWVKE